MDRPVERRPKFTALYMETTDTVGHLVGPDHPDMEKAIKSVDHAVGVLLRGLQHRDMLEALDIVVVSDHGMTQLSEDRLIQLDKLIDYNAVEISCENCNTLLYPKPGFALDLYKNLTSVKLNMKVFVKNPEHFISHLEKGKETGIRVKPTPIPEQYHFKHSPVCSRNSTPGRSW